MLPKVSKSVLEAAKQYESPSLAVKAALKKQLLAKIGVASGGTAAALGIKSSVALKAGGAGAKVVGSSFWASTLIKVAVVAMTGALALGVGKKVFDAKEKKEPSHAKSVTTPKESSVENKFFEDTNPQETELPSLDEGLKIKKSTERAKLDEMKLLQKSQRARKKRRGRVVNKETQAQAEAKAQAGAETQAEFQTQAEVQTKNASNPDFVGPYGKRGLEAERKFLSAAWNAKNFNQNEAALRILSKHRSAFPKGVLSGEREGLKTLIQCLGSKRNHRKNAKKYLKKNPGSFLKEKIEKACL